MINYKVMGAALADALTTIVIWLLSFAHVDVPTLVAAAMLTIVTFIVGWFVPSQFTTPTVARNPSNTPTQ